LLKQLSGKRSQVQLFALWFSTSCCWLQSVHPPPKLTCTPSLYMYGVCLFLPQCILQVLIHNAASRAQTLRRITFRCTWQWTMSARSFSPCSSCRGSLQRRPQATLARGVHLEQHTHAGRHRPCHAPYTQSGAAQHIRYTQAKTANILTTCKLSRHTGEG
jgi:hypothetical protein